MNIVEMEKLCQIYKDLSEKESSDMWSSEGVLRMLLCVKLREKVFGALEFDFRRGWGTKQVHLYLGRILIWTELDCITIQLSVKLEWCCTVT